jgi:hypothetical protein
MAQHDGRGAPRRKGEMATMGPARGEFEVTLPIGYTDPAGQVHRLAVIRKMTGHEEALLYDPALSPSRLVTEVIRGCLLRLGDVQVIDAGIVTDLYTADRNFLLLELRRITLGDRMLASYRCPSCGGSVSVMEDLNRFDTLPIADDARAADFQLQLEDGFVDRRGELQTMLILALPRGTDEDFVSPMIERDPLKAQDALILRCIRQFGTLPKAELEAYGVKILRDLTLGDRLAIDAAINSQAPGVDLTSQVECLQCGHAFTAALDMTHFFALSPAEASHSAGRYSTSPITFTGPGSRS